MTAPEPSAPSAWFELRHASTGRPIFVVVPERRMLAIHGAGPRNAEDFRLAATVLRTVADLARNSLPRIQRSEPRRQVVEITWPIDGRLTIDEILESLHDDRQPWRQMIELSGRVTDAAAMTAIDTARRLGGRAIPLVRLLRITEGSAAQILHTGTGSFPDCARTLLRLVIEAGLRPAGDLHEIVIADAADVGRERSRSILRVPVGPG